MGFENNHKAIQIIEGEETKIVPTEELAAAADEMMLQKRKTEGLISSGKEANAKTYLWEIERRMKDIDSASWQEFDMFVSETDATEEERSALMLGKSILQGVLTMDNKMLVLTKRAATNLPELQIANKFARRNQSHSKIGSNCVRILSSIGDLYEAAGKIATEEQVRELFKNGGDGVLSPEELEEAKKKAKNLEIT